ncbi:hypothetical protein IW140_005714 [Coemansia sp. RSA 1813]|nr:hypothetical protein EV178_005737 [Coemansia sp. RSA 1646]KAJ1768196.1 hypothetical protein LPJ74_004973 [Coemansia sp. RSA 1843]KAJ2211102.1 hypothetical protein EV179_005749 [Coemansia sp. RSA 487]KAJ2564532.1 hypothetical protein IW140_005714 [Coemansia sp. RSA 1813]
MTQQQSPHMPSRRPESSKKKAVRFQDSAAPSAASAADNNTLSAELTKPAPSATSSQLPRRKPAKRSARHFVEEPLYMMPSHFVLLQDSTYELLRGLTNLSSAVENDPLYFDQLLGAAVNVKHAFDLGRIEVVNGMIRPRNTSLCHECITTVSSVWRSGPEGPRTLCNACGLRYYKQNQRRALEAKRRELRQATDSSASLNPEDDSVAEQRAAEGSSSAGRNIADAHRTDASSAGQISSSLPSTTGHDLGYRKHFYDAKASFAEDDAEDDDAEYDDDVDSGITLGYFGLPASEHLSNNSQDPLRSSPELTRPSISNLCEMHPAASEQKGSSESGKAIERHDKQTEAPYVPSSDELQFIPSIKNILAGVSSTSSTLPLPSSLPRATAPPSSYHHPRVDNSSYYYNSNGTNVADIRYQEQGIYSSAHGK